VPSITLNKKPSTTYFWLYLSSCVSTTGYCQLLTSLTWTNCRVARSRWQRNGSPGFKRRRRNSCFTLLRAQKFYLIEDIPVHPRKPSSCVVFACLFFPCSLVGWDICHFNASSASLPCSPMSCKWCPRQPFPVSLQLSERLSSLSSSSTSFYLPSLFGCLSSPILCIYTDNFILFLNNFLHLPYILLLYSTCFSDAVALCGM